MFGRLLRKEAKLPEANRLEDDTCSIGTSPVGRWRGEKTMSVFTVPYVLHPQRLCSRGLQIWQGPLPRRVTWKSGRRASRAQGPLSRRSHATVRASRQSCASIPCMSFTGGLCELARLGKRLVVPHFRFRHFFLSFLIAPFLSGCRGAAGFPQSAVHISMVTMRKVRVQTSCEIQRIKAQRELQPSHSKVHSRRPSFGIK